MLIYLKLYNKKKKNLNFLYRRASNYNNENTNGYSYTIILKQFLNGKHIAQYVNKKVIQKYFDKSFFNPGTGHHIPLQFALFKFKNFENRRRRSAGGLNLYKEYMDWLYKNRKSIIEKNRLTSIRYTTKHITNSKIINNLKPFIIYKNDFQNWEKVEPLQASISINCKILEVVNDIANGRMDSLKSGFIYPKVNSNLIESGLEYHNELINGYDILKNTTLTLGLIDGFDAETTSTVIFGLSAILLPVHYELCSGTMFLSNILDLQQMDLPIFLNNFSELIKLQYDVFFNNTSSSLLLDYLVRKNTKFCLLDTGEDDINSLFRKCDEIPNSYGIPGDIPSALPKLFYHDPRHLIKS